MNKKQAIETARAKSKAKPDETFWVVRDWEERTSYLVLNLAGLDMECPAESDVIAVFEGGERSE